MIDRKNFDELCKNYSDKTLENQDYIFAANFLIKPNT